MVRTGAALLLLAAVSAAAGDDPGCPFCGQNMAAAEGEAWYQAYRCADSACGARLQVFPDGTEKGLRIDEDGNRRIIVKDPRLVEDGDSARENRPTRGRSGRRRVRQDREEVPALGSDRRVCVPCGCGPWRARRG